jgi:hypothetical protein
MLSVVLSSVNEVKVTAAMEVLPQKLAKFY